MKKFDDAKEYYRKARSWIPTIRNLTTPSASSTGHRLTSPRMEARAKLGLKPEEPLKDKKVCAELKDKNSAGIEDGIEDLNKALQLRPDYDDAMAYMNLMYRRKGGHGMRRSGGSRRRSENGG